MKRKQLNELIIQSIETKVFHLLCESAEVQLKNKQFIWNVNEPYYAQAFGVMQALVVLNYCSHGANNTPAEKTNMNWWFDDCKDIIREEIETNGL